MHLNRTFFLLTTYSQAEQSCGRLAGAATYIHLAGEYCGFKNQTKDTIGRLYGIAENLCGPERESVVQQEVKDGFGFFEEMKKRAKDKNDFCVSARAFFQNMRKQVSK